MNADPNESVIKPEDNPESEAEGELVEVGELSGTKGGVFGFSHDPGGGWQRF